MALHPRAVVRGFQAQIEAADLELRQGRARAVECRDADARSRVGGRRAPRVRYERTPVRGDANFHELPWRRRGAPRSGGWNGSRSERVRGNVEALERLRRIAVQPRSPVPVLEEEATVTAVCKKAGCWMQIEDEGRTAMVRWETGCGGRFTFSVEAIGRRVLVQGSFYPKSISAEDAEHLAAESGGALAVEREGYELNASAVLLIEQGR